MTTRRPATSSWESEPDGSSFVLVGCRSCLQPRQRGVVSAYWFSICRGYVPAGSIESMRVLIVEDEPFIAEAIRDGLRPEAIAADIAGDGDTALELLSSNGYDIAVLNRNIPGPSGDQIGKRILASGSGTSPRLYRPRETQESTADAAPASSSHDESIATRLPRITEALRPSLETALPRSGQFFSCCQHFRAPTRCCTFVGCTRPGPRLHWQPSRPNGTGRTIQRHTSRRFG